MKRISISRLFLAGAAALICIGLILDWINSDSTIDIHLHDTYITGAPLHVFGSVTQIFLLTGGIYYIALIFLLFAGIYHSFPKISRRGLMYRPGLIHFIVSFSGLLLGLLLVHYEFEPGPPKRYYNSGSRSGFIEFFTVNRAITTLAVTVVIAQIIFLLNIVYSIRAGNKVR